MKRREFIGGLGSAAAWPLTGRAQQGERVRRIGVLLARRPDDPIGQTLLSAFVQELHELGWSVGRNLQIDYRWGRGDLDLNRRFAAELVAGAPDVLVASGGPVAGSLQQVTRTIPIVFAGAIDPVGAGWVQDLAQPGGNMTGFILFEYGLSGKWLQLLKEVAPRVTRVAVIRDPGVPGGPAQFGAIQAVAPSLGMNLIPVDSRDAAATARALTAFAGGSNGGLIVVGGARASLQRDQIIALAARHLLPAVYNDRTWVTDGGLISYGVDLADQYRRTPGYVDRILKGESPANLPAQAPTKYETLINLKTANALGLTIPETLLATADEVIQ